MSGDPCQCGGTADEQRDERERTPGPIEIETDVLSAALPAELQTTLGRFLGTDRVETIGEWARAIRRQVDGSIAVGDLCVAEEATPHRGRVSDETYHFACFYDAVILAALRDESVEIHTESPGGVEIELRATGDDLTVRPETAVFSFGIDAAVDPPSGEAPSLEDGYAAICPYVKAFPTADAYRAWSKAVDAPTVAMPLAGATELAAELAR